MIYEKLRCENVKINRMIVIFTELFKVYLTILQFNNIIQTFSESISKH